MAAERPTGRCSAETVKHWSSIVRSVGYTPMVVMGEPPRKSPGNVNYRVKRYRNQLIGCCGGENVTQQVECLLRMPPHRAADEPPDPPIALSPLLTYWFGRRYSRRAGVRLPAEGSIVSHNVLALAEAGAGLAPIATYPPTPEAYRGYSDRRDPPQPALDAARRHRVKAHALIPNAEVMLHWLARGFPLAIGAEFPEGILATREDGYFDCSGGPGPVGHCVTLYDFDRDADVAIVGNSWPGWGRLSRDPELPAECRGWDNVGWCRLSDLLTLFTPALMGQGRSEAVAVNTVEGWEPRVRSFQEVL